MSAAAVDAVRQAAVRSAGDSLRVATTQRSSGQSSNPALGIPCHGLDARAVCKQYYLSVVADHCYERNSQLMVLNLRHCVVPPAAAFLTDSYSSRELGDGLIAARRQMVQELTDVRQRSTRIRNFDVILTNLQYRTSA